MNVLQGRAAPRKLSGASRKPSPDRTVDLGKPTLCRGSSILFALAVLLPASTYAQQNDAREDALFSRSTRQLGIGLLIGAAGAALLDRLTGGAMLRVEVATLLVLVAAMMLLSGLLATLGPTRRALRIQPMEALREE